MTLERRVRRTQVERKAAAEHRVLAAAAKLVAEHGLRGLTLAAAGTRAGFSRGIATHHFGSRQALLEALAVHLQEKFHPPEHPGGSGRAALLDLVDAYLAHGTTEPLASRAFLVLWAEVLASEPTLRPVFAERDERFRALVASAVQAGVGDGSIRPNADPEVLAYVVVGLLRGAAMQALIARHPLEDDSLRTQVRILLDAGMASRTGESQN